MKDSEIQKLKDMKREIERLFRSADGDLYWRLTRTPYYVAGQPVKGGALRVCAQVLKKSEIIDYLCNGAELPLRGEMSSAEFSAFRKDATPKRDRKPDPVVNQRQLNDIEKAACDAAEAIMSQVLPKMVKLGESVDVLIAQVGALSKKVNQLEKRLSEKRTNS